MSNKNLPFALMFFSITLSFLFLIPFAAFAQPYTWTLKQLPITNGVSNDFHFLDKDTGWVVGENSASGKVALFYTVDGGDNWTDQSPDLAGNLWGIYFTDENIGYAVGENYNIYPPDLILLKTTDGGNNWQQQASPIAKGSLHDVYFTDSTHGFAVGQEVKQTSTRSIILRTTDGTTWSDVNHPERTGALSCVFFADTNHGCCQ